MWNLQRKRTPKTGWVEPRLAFFREQCRISWRTRGMWGITGAEPSAIPNSDFHGGIDCCCQAQRGQNWGFAGSQGLWGGMGLPGEFSPLNLPWVWDLGIKWTHQAVNSVKFLPPSSSTAVPPGTSHFLGHDCPKLCPNPTALPKWDFSFFSPQEKPHGCHLTWGNRLIIFGAWNPPGNHWFHQTHFILIPFPFPHKRGSMLTEPFFPSSMDKIPTNLFFFGLITANWAAQTLHFPSGFICWNKLDSNYFPSFPWVEIPFPGVVFLVFFLPCCYFPSLELSFARCFPFPGLVLFGFWEPLEGFFSGLLNVWSLAGGSEESNPMCSEQHHWEGNEGPW